MELNVKDSVCNLQVSVVTGILVIVFEEDLDINTNTYFRDIIKVIRERDTDDIKSTLIYFREGITINMPSDSSNLFHSLTLYSKEDLKVYGSTLEFRGLENVKLVGSNLTNLHCTFSGFQGEVLNVSNLNTENVTSFYGTFANCSRLKRLDVSSFKTKNAITMASMFTGCCSLNELDISMFKTFKVNDMSRMFRRCTNLKTVDVSNFDTRNVETTNEMFSLCYSLKNLDLHNFYGGSIETAEGMFWECAKLLTVNLEKFGRDSGFNSNSMFESCYSIKDVNLTSLHVEGPHAKFDNMFYDCWELTTIKINAESAKKFKNLGERDSDVFYNCRNIVRFV